MKKTSFGEKILEKEEITALFEEFLKNEGLEYLKANYGIKLPASIFRKELGCFESVVKYLKENKNQSITNISKLTKRAKSTISISYKKAKEKHPQLFEENGCLIPLNVITKEKNVLGNIILYLYQEKLYSIKKISDTLDRSYQTIWLTFKKRREEQ